MKENLKAIGSFIIGIAVLIGVAIVAMMLIRGGAWVSEMLYPWIAVLSSFAFVVCIFILLPLAAFKKTRVFSGTGFYIASYVFGVSLWVWSLLLTYFLWGGFALFVGLFLAGVGVLPIAMLATAFNGMWTQFGELVLTMVITYATRSFGYYLVSKAEENDREAV